MSYKMWNAHEQFTEKYPGLIMAAPTIHATPGLPVRTRFEHKLTNDRKMATNGNKRYGGTHEPRDAD